MPVKLYTLDSLLTDPEPVLALVRRRFPKAKQEKISINTPEIAECLKQTRDDVADDPKILAIAVADLKDHVDFCYSQFSNSVPDLSSLPHQLFEAQAVLFARVVLANLPIHVQRILLEDLLNKHFDKFNPLMERARKKYPSLERVHLAVNVFLVPKTMVKKKVRGSRTQRSDKDIRKTTSGLIPVNSDGITIN